MAKTTQTSTPKVFISHSHSDRDFATKIYAVLKDYRAETFFDQEEIRGGQSLPKRIQAGIDWCTVLLLMWSTESKDSKWVQLEWRTAWDADKDVLPYKLDETPLPEELRDLVFVPASDFTRGNDELLRSIYHPSRVPEPLTPRLEITPGKWQMDFDAFGVISGSFVWELRSNGQMSGQTTVLGFTVGLTGEWSYDVSTRTLNAHTVARGYGQTQHENWRIRFSTRQGNKFYGEDMAGRKYVLRRLD